MEFLNSEQQEQLIKIAINSLKHGYTHGAPALLDTEYINKGLFFKARTYVSINYGKDNIGCMGNPVEPVPMFLSISKNAFDAGFRDPRFPPINWHKLKHSTISFYLLEEPRIFTNKTIEEICGMINDDDSLMVSYGKWNGILLSNFKKQYRTLNSYVDAVIKKAQLSNTFDTKKLEILLFRTHKTPPVLIGNFL